MPKSVDNSGSGVDPRTPVLIGAGQLTDRDTPAARGRSAIDLMHDAARLSAHDAGLPASVLSGLDDIAVMRFSSDYSARFPCPFGRAANPPASLAARLGASTARCVYTHPAGDMPQWLVGHYAERIAGGDCELVLIGGAEAMRTMRAASRAGIALDWNEDGDAPREIGTARPAHSAHEAAHGMDSAIAMYPLFENAIRARAGRSIERHNRLMGELFAPFAAVARDNPLAARRDGFSAARIAAVGPDNRMIGFPYPKLMNAHAFVDQAAALLMTSVGRARSLGVDPARWVFVHGVADTVDHWLVSERESYHECRPIAVGFERALAMAGIGRRELAFLDLYSCFPCAVEVACDALGIAPDDPRGLTVTGGLPYFGGPGNNYVTHAIATMMQRLRAAPGCYGLVSGNGNYLTRHAFGIYGTAPIEGRWQREPAARYQAALDARPKPPFTTAPEGRARIETYTVMHGRSGPERGIVVGRLLDGGARFLANLPAATAGERAALVALESREGVGRVGVVRPAARADGANQFLPSA